MGTKKAVAPLLLIADRAHMCPLRNASLIVGRRFITQ